MTPFVKQIFAATAAATMLLQVAAPAFATDTPTNNSGSVNLVVTGNGADSSSTEKVDVSNNTTVTQNNIANVNNNVTANSTTGGNYADKNTNGDVTIRTGDATSAVAVANDLNKNAASVACCGTGDVNVKVDGNGADTNNKVNLNLDNTHSVFQDNKANVTNNVDANAKTGYNEADKNTGGSVTIMTGDASTGVDVSTHANANWAMIGGNGSNGGALSAVISGNGFGSDNKINLNADNKNSIVQDNYARIYNDVNANAKTGNNKADKNTGGDTMILTGDAAVTVGVDNNVNFNSADVDCGCIADVLAKVAGNGAYSDNRIKANLDSANSIFQGDRERAGNVADLNNNVSGNSKTGYNDTNKNTGPAGIDPVLVWTGDGSSDVAVSNNGNVNVVGPLTWDNMELSWDLSWFHFMFGH